MKLKKLSPAKTIVLASASKLALIPGTASAGKGGEPPQERPPLKLNQVAVPFDAIIPSFNDENFAPEESIFEEEYGDFEEVGVLFAGETQEGAVRLDFVISDLWFPQDGPQQLDVYLAYSTGLAPFEENDPPPGIGNAFGQQRSLRQGPGPGGPGGQGGPNGPPDGMDIGELNGSEGPIPELFDDSNGPGNAKEQRPGKVEHQRGQRPGGTPKQGEGPPAPDVDAGRLCLDLSHYEIIAGVRVGAAQQFLNAPTRLGQTLRNPNSVTISVELSDLGAFEPGQELYFQAAAFPANTTNFTQAQVSECDRYLIDAVFEDEPGSGSKNDATDEIPDDAVDSGDSSTDGKF